MVIYTLLYTHSTNIRFLILFSFASTLQSQQIHKLLIVNGKITNIQSCFSLLVGPMLARSPKINLKGSIALSWVEGRRNRAGWEVPSGRTTGTSPNVHIDAYLWKGQSCLANCLSVQPGVGQGPHTQWWKERMVGTEWLSQAGSLPRQEASCAVFRRVGREATGGEMGPAGHGGSRDKSGPIVGHKCLFVLVKSGFFLGQCPEDGCIVYFLFWSVPTSVGHTSSHLVPACLSISCLSSNLPTLQRATLALILGNFSATSSISRR